MKKFSKDLTIGIVLLLAVFTIPGNAEESKYGGAFLELGIGARAMAMGGAYVSVANDGSAFYWNPAGVSTLLQQELSGMYASLFHSLEKYHHIGFSRPLYGGIALGLNWIRLSVADIPRYLLDVEKYKLGYSNRVNDASTSAFDWQTLKELDIVLTDDPIGFNNYINDAFFLTLSKLYKVDVDFGWQYFVLPVQFPMGINLKFIRQSLFNHTASGFGLDWGGMMKFGIDDLFDDNRLGKFAVGVAVKDLWNTKITWDTDSRHSDKIKRSWYLGSSYFQPIARIRGQLLFSYALERRYERVHHFGVEYVYYERLAIRFGLDNQQFTAGVGLKLLIFRFDYAFKGHELGGSHRISTSVRF